MTVVQIIESLDLSKVVSEHVDISDMCRYEFDIHEWLDQSAFGQRLTYCYYHSWTCTDTQVGLRVWFLDKAPVCLSHQPYRKSDENFEWLSVDAFNKSREYVDSMVEDGRTPSKIVSDESIASVLNKFDDIDYKKYEVKNLKA